MGRRLALLIGCGKYEGGDWLPLSTPEFDVLSLDKILRARTICGFATAKCIDRPHDVVRRDIEDFFRQDAYRNDTLLLYFSGHGITCNGELHLVFVDTIRDNPSATGMPGGLLCRLMDNCNAGRIILILDCCHSGGIQQDVMNLQNNGRSRIVMAACAPGQTALEGAAAGGKLRESVFTHLFVDGLKEGKADKFQTGRITIQDLYDYVATQIEQRRIKQKPAMHIMGEGREFMLCRSKRRRAPVVSPFLTVRFGHEKTIKTGKDRYHIVRAIGQGGMGTVFEVRGERQGVCALKAMSLTGMPDQSLVQRFQTEVANHRIVSKLGNPHIVRILDSGEVDDCQFLVSEYVDGRSLADDLWDRNCREQPQPYTFDEARLLIHQVCEGLTRIHGTKVDGEGLVHRDLKPDNILLAGDRRGTGHNHPVIAKICDFGLVVNYGLQNTRFSSSSGAGGTFLYMAPEQLEEGPRPVLKYVDLFAVGKILTEMLTLCVPRDVRDIEGLCVGAPAPKDAGGDGSVAAANARSERSFVLREGVDVPVEGIRVILTCCLAEDPYDRFQSAGELMHALRRADMIHRIVLELKQGRRAHAIERSDVAAAYALAKIGAPGAQERLIDWCSQGEEESQHEQAAYALSQVEGGVEVLLTECAESDKELAPARRKCLLRALSCVLRKQDDEEPVDAGQEWMAKLDPQSRQAVQRMYRADNRRIAAKIQFSVFMRYAGVTALLAAIASVICSSFGGNVLWRSFPPDGSRTVSLFFGTMIVGVLWGGMFPFAFFWGSQFERPLRKWMILLFSALAGVVSTAGISLFAVTQGRGPLAVECGSPAEAAALLALYYATLSVVFSTMLTLYFLVKERARVHRLLPSKLLSLLLWPLTFVVVTAAVTLPLFAPSKFLWRELLGELIIVVLSGFAVGLVDCFGDLPRFLSWLKDTFVTPLQGMGWLRTGDKARAAAAKG